MVSGNSFQAVLNQLNKKNSWLQIDYKKNFTIESMLKFSPNSNPHPDIPDRFWFANFNVNMNRNSNIKTQFTISKNNNNKFWDVNLILELPLNDQDKSKYKYIIPGIGIMKNSNLMSINFNIFTGIHSKDKNTTYTTLASLSSANISSDPLFGSLVPPYLLTGLECLKWRVKGSGRVPKKFSQSSDFSQFDNLNGNHSFINSATKFNSNLIMIVANQHNFEFLENNSYISSNDSLFYAPEFSILYIGYPTLSGGNIYGIKVNGFSSTISISCDKFFTGSSWENIVIVGLVKENLSSQQAFILTGGGKDLSISPNSLYVNLNSENASFHSVYSTSKNLIIAGNSDSLTSTENLAFFYFISYDNIESDLMNTSPTYYQYPNSQTTVISGMKPINNNASSGLYIIFGGYSSSVLDYSEVVSLNGSIIPKDLKPFITIYNANTNTFLAVEIPSTLNNNSVVSDAIPNYQKNQNLVALSLNVSNEESSTIQGAIVIFELEKNLILSKLTNSSNTGSNGDSSISALINNSQNDSIISIGNFKNIDERDISLLCEIKNNSDNIQLDMSFKSSNSTFSVTGTGGSQSTNLFNGSSNQAVITGPSYSKGKKGNNKKVIKGKK